VTLKARTIAALFATLVLPTVASAADTSVFHDDITIARADFSSATDASSRRPRC
jgi:hypothetical protein